MLAGTASIGARPHALLGLMILAHASAATHVFAAKAHRTGISALVGAA